MDLENQLGTVLVFKPGTTQQEVREALVTLENLLENFPALHSFNPKHGGPVWYIP